MKNARDLTTTRWGLLAVSCLINLFAGSIYAWSVFASALAEKFSALAGSAVTAGDLAIAFSIANGLAPIPMIFGGAVNDRFGPRFVIIGGGVLMGPGLYFFRNGAVHRRARLFVRAPFRPWARHGVRLHDQQHHESSRIGADSWAA